MCGAFLTGIFATSSVSSLDGVTLAPGGIDGNGVQIARQLAEIAAIASWSFVCSVIMLMILKYIPGLHLRVQDDVEADGLDIDQFYGEVIGEWSLFETENSGTATLTQGIAVETAAAPSSSSDNEDQKITPKSG